MEKEIKSNYARVDIENSVVELFEDEPHAGLSHLVLKNVKITFKELGTIKITGDKVEWGFSFESIFVADMKEKPAAKYIKMGYKTIVDFFKGIKKPYVKRGWYVLENTTPYHAVISKWFIVL